MNCCNEYGDCDQGKTCPSRTGIVLPHQAAHAARVARIKSTRPVWMDGKAKTAHSCDDLGLCQGRGDCDCTHPAPPEAGNFKIIDLGPEDDSQPLGYAESMALVRALLAWLVAVVCTVGAMALAVGYSTERWSDVLWTYLAGLA